MTSIDRREQIRTTDTDRRAQARTLQRYLVRFEDAGELRMAFTQDVSSRGVFLKTRFPPPPGAGLRMLIRTSRGSETRDGVVIWTRHNFGRPDDPQQASGAGIRLMQRDRQATRDH